MMWFKPRSNDLVTLLDSKVFPDELKQRMEKKHYKLDDNLSVRINRRGKSWSSAGYIFKLTGDRLYISKKKVLRPRKKRPWETSPNASIAYSEATTNPDLLSTAEASALLDIPVQKVRKIFEPSEWHHSNLRYGDKARAFFYQRQDILDYLESQKKKKLHRTIDLHL